MSKDPAHCQDPLEAEDDLTLVHATRKAVLQPPAGLQEGMTASCCELHKVPHIAV